MQNSRANILECILLELLDLRALVVFGSPVGSGSDARSGRVGTVDALGPLLLRRLGGRLNSRRSHFESYGYDRSSFKAVSCGCARRSRTTEFEARWCGGKVGRRGDKSRQRGG